jgi:hypothetical protein
VFPPVEVPGGFEEDELLSPHAIQPRVPRTMQKMKQYVGRAKRGLGTLEDIVNSDQDMT